MSLKIRCPNSGRECDWTGELVDLLKVNLLFCIAEFHLSQETRLQYSIKQELTHGKTYHENNNKM